MDIRNTEMEDLDGSAPTFGGSATNYDTQNEFPADDLFVGFLDH